jgi:hypothetical protein
LGLAMGAPPVVAVNDNDESGLTIAAFVVFFPVCPDRCGLLVAVTVVAFGERQIDQNAAHVLSTVPSVTHTRRAMPALERPSAVSAKHLQFP